MAQKNILFRKDSDVPLTTEQMDTNISLCSDFGMSAFYSLDSSLLNASNTSFDFYELDKPWLDSYEGDAILHLYLSTDVSPADFSRSRPIFENIPVHIHFNLGTIQFSLDGVAWSSNSLNFVNSNGLIQSIGFYLVNDVITLFLTFGNSYAKTFVSCNVKFVLESNINNGVFIDVPLVALS